MSELETLQEALPHDKLVEALGLGGLLNTPDTSGRQTQLFRCSLIEGVGYADGFKWLSDIL
jgi:hypothetical protein